MGSNPAGPAKVIINISMNIFGNEIDTGFKPHLQLIEDMTPVCNTTPTTKHFIIKPADRDKQVVDFIEKTLGFYVFHSELFYTPTNATRTIHIDGDVGTEPYDKIYKINWIYGGADSEMIWYETDKGYKPTKNLTSVGTYALAFDPSRCKSIYSMKIKNCAIIEAGRPHTVINYNEPRWAISYVISSRPWTPEQDTLLSPSWDEIIKSFSKYISL